LIDVLKNGKPVLCAVFERFDLGLTIQIFENEKDNSLFACFLENYKTLCFLSPWNYNPALTPMFKEFYVRVYFLFN
jgi:hypothetical protein